MTQDSLTPAPQGCEAVQAQLSELADSGAPVPAALQAHLDACPECARFAQQWVAGPPEALRRPVRALPEDARLRERILAAAAADADTRPNIVRFPVRGDAARTPWTTWLGRIAACAALAAFSYWLLNPTISSVRVKPEVAAAEPTISQNLNSLEARSKQEQQVLQTAIVDGGRHVHNSVRWSMAALEL